MNRTKALVRSLRLSVLALVFLSLVAPAMAASTGGILVTVYEFDNETQERSLLPGATVMLSEPNGQLQQMVQITGPDGNANFPVVPVGSTYTIEVAMPGYQTVLLDNQRVLADRIVPVGVAMVSELQEEVTVSARQNVVELDEGTTSQTEISEELFEDLPVLGRQYQNILSVAAGVQDSDGDGNPNVHGSREQDFQMMVDGVSNVDPLTGELMSEINPDAIEEIEIVDSGADASFGGAVGGFGTISYKQGGNEFEGTFTMLYSDSIFDNDGAGQTQPNDFRVLAPAIYLSGPVVKDKLWFVASHELFRGEFPIPVIGGEDFVQDQRRFRNFDQLTWQASGKNKLQLKYQADPTTIEPAGVNALVPLESGFGVNFGGPTVSLKWTNTFSGDLFFESVAAFSDIETRVEPFAPGTKNNCVQINQLSAQLAPYEESYCTDDRAEGFGTVSGTYLQTRDDARTRWTYTFSAEKFISNFLGGTHKVKFGFGLEKAGFERLLEVRDSLRLTDLAGQATIAPGQVPGAVPRERGTINRFFPSRQTTESRGNYYSMYVSDAWDIRPNLVLTMGVRWTREELSSDGYKPIDIAGERAAFDAAVTACIQTNCGSPVSSSCAAGCAEQNAAFFTAHQLDDPALYPACEDQFGNGAINPGICRFLETASQRGEVKVREQERFTITNDNFEPRVSVSWDPWNDGKTKIAASWGRFYGNTFLAPIVSELGPDRSLQQYNINKLGENFQFPDFAVRTFSGFQISEVSRDLKRQFSDEWTIRFERELAAETSLIARYVNRKYRNQFQDTDINKKPVFYDELTDFQLFDTYGDGAGGTRCDRIDEFADCTGRAAVELRAVGPGGSVRAVTIEGPDGIPDLTAISPTISEIYRVGNFNSSTYEAYILELVRRFYQNWEMRASYTWSESLGQAESFAQALGDDATNADDEFGPLSTDQRHVFTLFGRVFIPRWGGFRLGATLNYQSGLPYSVIRRRNVLSFPSDLAVATDAYDGSVVFATPRTLYPSRQRNDQRNSPFWQLNVNFQKEFDIRDVRATVQIDIYNVLNDDTSQIFYVLEQDQGENAAGERTFTRIPVATRNFGRRFQLLLKANF